MRTIRFTPRARRFVGAWLAVIAVSASLFVTATAASASPVANKGTPPAPTIGQYSPQAAPAVTGAAKQQADAKAAAAASFYTKAQAQWKAAASGSIHAKPQACVPSCPAPAPPTAKTLAVPLLQQQTENWCGPTTLAMIAAYKGVGFAGSTTYAKELAAAKLATDPSTGSTWDARSLSWYGADSVPGGPWSSWYPMQDALNYKTYNISHNYYAPVALPGNPTSAQQSAFRSALVTDISHNWAFAANQDSVPSYQIGRQPNGTWQHWWAAIGYSNNGNTTNFNDPASWSKGLMSSAPTTGGRGTVVIALGGRGYVW
jgi:hypothetical protein